MSRVEWPGIHERFWPDTDKPWRVTSGFGVFEDFATQAEAQRFYETMKRDHTDAHLRPGEPFNAVEDLVSTDRCFAEKREAGPPRVS